MSVRNAFSDGLSDALLVGAAVAVLTALFTIWRAPGRTSRIADRDVQSTNAVFETPATVAV